MLLNTIVSNNITQNSASPLDTWRVPPYGAQLGSEGGQGADAAWGNRAEGQPGQLEGRTPGFPRRQRSSEPCTPGERQLPRAAPDVKSVVTSVKVINS